MLQIPQVPLSRSAAQEPERPPKNLPKISSVIRTRESVAAVLAKAYFDSLAGVEIAAPLLAFNFIDDPALTDQLHRNAHQLITLPAGKLVGTRRSLPRNRRVVVWSVMATSASSFASAAPASTK